MCSDVCCSVVVAYLPRPRAATIVPYKLVVSYEFTASWLMLFVVRVHCRVVLCRAVRRQSAARTVSARPAARRPLVGYILDGRGRMACVGEIRLWLLLLMLLLPPSACNSRPRQPPDETARHSSTATGVST